MPGRPSGSRARSASGISAAPPPGVTIWEGCPHSGTPNLGWQPAERSRESCESRVRDPAPPRCHRGARRHHARADPGHRRRHGHGHPAGPTGRGRLPGRALRGLGERPGRQQRPADAHPAAHHRGHPPRVPRGRRGHHRDQHLQRQRDLAVRLRHGRAGLRAQPRGRPPRPPGLRRGHRADPRAAALRRRRARADDAHRLHLAGRQRPGRPQRDLRPARRGVLRGDPRPARRRRRPRHHRDDLRHPQRQGGHLGGRPGLHRPRPPLAGRHQRHHHRRVRSHPVRPDHRGLLELGAPRPAAARRPQLRPRCAGDASVRRRAVAHRRRLRVGVPQRRPAQRLR